MSIATFISIDTEFTGLGTENTRTKNIEDRYRILRSLAQSHALLSMGMTVVVMEEGKAKVHSFNFLLFCQKDYKVSPNSLAFLVENGFDFNNQIENGIPYSFKRPNGSPYENALRMIFRHLISLNIPVVIHNGLLDLIFLYQSFYADLPEKLQVFLCDLNEMFSGGLYDTKYIADYAEREDASFLAYLYQKCQRTSSVDVVVMDPIDLNLPPLTIPPTKAQEGMLKKQANSKKPFCEQYASHGYCGLKEHCKKSHNLDVILNQKLKRKLLISNDESESVPSFKKARVEVNDRFTHFHSAHYDSYMTACVFASQMLTSGYEAHANKLYLMSKDFPLLVEKSAFSKTSQAHDELIRK